MRTALLQELARRGGAARPADVYGPLAERFRLTEDDLTEVTAGEQRSKWENMVRWARNDLRKQGLLDNSARGMWVLTSAGLVAANERS